MSTDKADPSNQPGGQVVTAPRLAVVLGRPAEASRICRVEAPGRVLRIWALLNDASNELHQISLPREAAARLQGQFDALTAELERSVSPALADELRRLIHNGKTAAPTADELRMEYTSLLGWTGGLVIEMLSQLEVVGAKIAPSGLRAHPATGQVRAADRPKAGARAGHGPADGATRPAAG